MLCLINPDLSHEMQESSSCVTGEVAGARTGKGVCLRSAGRWGAQSGADRPQAQCSRDLIWYLEFTPSQQASAPRRG